MAPVNREDHSDRLKVGIAQMAPVWLDRDRTLAKIVRYVDEAADAGCRLVAFGEALLPGYPFWIELTDGARFNSPVQKAIHAHYMREAVQIEAGHLTPLLRAASRHRIAVILGCIERAPDRGGHSLYCSLIYVDPRGEIRSVHRKLMPTYEERLTWAQGDGHGLRVHPLGPFTVGGLNCWENWMPLARATLYALGEDLHVAIWPGSARNTADITRFIAKEARSYVLSVSGLMRQTDFPEETPHRELILAESPELLADGGSCLAGPDGEWVVAPVVGEERVIPAAIDHGRVRAERQNFDPAGHYARPDVMRLVVDRSRQSLLQIVEPNEPESGPLPAREMDTPALDVQIRSFMTADEDAVVELWRRCGLLRPWNDPHQDIARKLGVPSDLFLVGTKGGQVIATVMAGYEGHRGWINYLAVAPHARRKGIGRKIMAEAECRLRLLGCPKINLQIRRENSEAILFYKRIGFSEDTVLSYGKRLAREE
jgi:nitrilase